MNLRFRELNFANSSNVGKDQASNKEVNLRQVVTSYDALQELIFGFKIFEKELSWHWMIESD